MPDIAMCSNKTCKKRKTCYRFTAKPDYRQSYSNFKGKNCRYYWDNQFSNYVNDSDYLKEMDKVILEDIDIPKKLMKMLDVACKHNLKRRKNENSRKDNR